MEGKCPRTEVFTEVFTEVIHRSIHANTVCKHLLASRVSHGKSTGRLYSGVDGCELVTALL